MKILSPLTLLLIVIIFPLVFYPETGSILGMMFFLSSLFFSIYTIFQTHKGSEYALQKILKDVGMMVLMLIIILFLGGIAAMLVNYQVSMKWGEVAGVVSAIGASFVVGYLVRKGMMQLSK